MTRMIKEVMTRDLQCVHPDANLAEVARIMRDKDIGDVLVCDHDGKLRGIVTDRDIVVRGVAQGCDLATTCVGDVFTEGVTKLPESATIEQAVELMRSQAVRRLPVVRDEVPVGIVSIGDLAQARDPQSALADISSAAPNN